MPRPLAALAALLLASAVGAGACAAEPARLRAPELDAQRGGFTVDGLTFEFGAVVRTAIDGRTALETQVTWTPEGQRIVRSGDGSLTPLTADNLAALAARGLDVRGLKPGEGFVSADGSAVVVQRLTDGSLVNGLLNTGSDRSYRQDTEVTLILPGFEAVQQDIGAARLAHRLADDVQAASALTR